MEINLGKIQIIPKDAWDSTRIYTYLDIVKHEGIVYLCKTESDVPRGTMPTDTTYYMPLVRDGVDGGGIAITAQEITDLFNDDKPIIEDTGALVINGAALTEEDINTLF